MFLGTTSNFFNPSYKLDIVPFVEGKKYSLRLPKDLIGKFVANEESIYAFVEAEKEKMEKPLPALVQTSGEGGNRIYHRVKSGDVLGKIANKYGVTVTNLKRWNSLRSNTIQIGQRLTIYTNKKPLSPSTVVAKSTSNSRKQGCRRDLCSPKRRYFMEYCPEVSENFYWGYSKMERY